jgi:hypothetical protein
MGFLLGAQAVAYVTNSTTLATPTAWVVGLLAGIVLAALSYAIYAVAVATLGASVGYLLGASLMTALGFGSQVYLTFFVGILVALLFGILILLLNLARVLIIINTALGGASALVLGALVGLGQIPVLALNTNLLGTFLQHSPAWGVVWLVLAVCGFLFQLSNTRTYRLESYTPARNVPEVQS